MDKQMMWIVAVVIALFVGAFGGYYFEKTKLTSQMMMAQTDLQKQVDDLKMKNDQLMANPAPDNGTMMKTNSEPSGAMMQTSPAPSGAMMQK